MTQSGVVSVLRWALDYAAGFAACPMKAGQTVALVGGLFWYPVAMHQAE